MEGRPNRGRGGQWRRGGSAGGNDGGGADDRRGRGRGGHHRGRGKRDHYRGRSRGFPENGAAVFSRRNPDEQDEKENAEDETTTIHTRRKLESNWDRYEESEKEEVRDDVPVQRGTDYHVLLTSAGDSFAQFRFSEEKDWEVDSLGTNQVPALFVDLEVLARSLQELPLHQRLDLEPGVVQDSTPVELPSLTVLNKVDSALGGFKPPGPGHSEHSQQPFQSVSSPSVSSQTSTAVIGPVDESEEVLDLLLGLQKPAQSLSLTHSKTSDSVEEMSANSERAASPVEVDQTETEEETETVQQKPEHVQQITEEDLEDWLDSMIS